ncbi:hypothetical protein HCN44_007092 [Aphidius gifuensis]|uniref:Uncharacterized protein n=1 Tax=Aphidius gifuensis TaxID=684658 RepID=A0A834XKY2_APHGI|nr:hypothetical protein HCN44_007092 [Aphidius gifuensis]
MNRKKVTEDVPASDYDYAPEMNKKKVTEDVPASDYDCAPEMNRKKVTEDVPASDYDYAPEINRKKVTEDVPASDYDYIPKNKKNKIEYAYKGRVVRKKAERRKLTGWDCKDCEKWYQNLNLSAEEVQKLFKRLRVLHFTYGRGDYNFIVAI